MLPFIFIALIASGITLSIARSLRLMTPRHRFNAPKRIVKERHWFVAEAKLGFWGGWISIDEGGKLCEFGRVQLWNTKEKAKWAIDLFNDINFEKCKNIPELVESFEEKEFKDLCERHEKAFDKRKKPTPPKVIQQKEDIV